MLQGSFAFSGFSVNDQAVAKDFYAHKLGLEVTEDAMGLHLKLPGGAEVFVYSKADHTAASFTILNFVVKDIDQTVSELTNAGVQFERYDNMPAPQDEKGILRGLAAQHGPDIAWFKDPAGNILAVLQQS
jgi:predicted enzyme related to lactoylglutathione lyase